MVITMKQNDLFRRFLDAWALWLATPTMLQKVKAEVLTIADRIKSVRDSLVDLEPAIRELARRKSIGFPVTLTMMGDTIAIEFGRPNARSSYLVSGEEEEAYNHPHPIQTDARKVRTFFASTVFLLPGREHQFVFALDRPLANGVAWIIGPATIQQMTVGHEVCGSTNEGGAQVGFLHRMLQVGETVVVRGAAMGD